MLMSNISGAANSVTLARPSRFEWRVNQIAQGLFQRSIAIALFLFLWELAPRLGWINRAFLPPFSEVVAHGWAFALSGGLFPNVLSSLERALGSFSLAAVTAIPVGILLAWYEPFDRYFNSLLQLLRQFNSISLVPVFVLFFGARGFTRLMIEYWVVVWPILLSTVSGVKFVDPTLIRYGRSLSLPEWVILSRIVLPSALPSIVSGLRLSATYSFLVLVFSEQVGARDGLGFLIENAQYVLGIHILYVAILVLALLGLTADGLILFVEKKLTTWDPDKDTHSSLGA